MSEGYVEDASESLRSKTRTKRKVYVKRCSNVKSTMQWLYQCEAKAQVVKIIILVGTLEKCAFLSLLILKSYSTSGLVMVESVLLS